MALTPAFDTPNNNEVADYLRAEANERNRKIAGDIVKYIDKSLMSELMMVNRKKFNFTFEGYITDDAFALVRAEYMAAGWSEVRLVSKDVGWRDPAYTYKITLCRQ
ncbi:MAG: hypothetical protein KGH64_00575 [Candidatus Micrarchaeota archaeon]|nr:hypothetical protein [Candidatus Micrarchaeota archaeon]